MLRWHCIPVRTNDNARHNPEVGIMASFSSDTIVLFLCGDVMTGRGIDQILPNPVKPQLYEPHVRSAISYVRFAEETGIRIERPVTFDYVWGDAISELEKRAPAVRVANLETTVTTSEDAMPSKGIHYRMHPDNAPCLTAAKLNCCVLANNHVMDWGERGLLETLDTLNSAGIMTVGAGRNLAEAAAPATLNTSVGPRVRIFAWALPTSGVPESWAADHNRAGVNMIGDLSKASADVIARAVRVTRKPGEIAVVSLHWGENWGYRISSDERGFAHRLIDTAGVDVVYGHSSHHAKGIEVHNGKLILYGCGDMLNDYEGIGGHEEYRPDLGLMYFPALDTSTGSLQRLVMVPTITKAFRINRAAHQDGEWLGNLLTREGAPFGTCASLEADGSLSLSW
jgi:poly-gamma-glutamate synthesis protein (capsule biosynthesis protein)